MADIFDALDEDPKKKPGGVAVAPAGDIFDQVAPDAPESPADAAAPAGDIFDQVAPDHPDQVDDPELAGHTPQPPAPNNPGSAGALETLKNAARTALPGPFSPVVDLVANAIHPPAPAPVAPGTPTLSPEEEAAQAKKKQIRDTVFDRVAPQMGPIMGPVLETEGGRRNAAAFGSGAVGTAANLLAAAPAAEQLIRGKQSVASQYGIKTADALEKLSGDLMPENPTFFNNLSSGVASMAAFMLPGAGAESVAAALPRLGVFAAKLGPAIGASISTVLESATEAGGVYQNQLKKGIKPELAAKDAFSDFWQNVLFVGLTNHFGVYGEKAAGLKKALASASLEGLQEGYQQIIQSLSQNELPNWNEVGQSAGIGALIGAPAGVMVDALQGEHGETPGAAPGTPPGTAPQTPKTPVSDAILGPKASQYLKTKFPSLYDGINNTELPLSKEQLDGLLHEAASAGEAALLAGAKPEEADLAAVHLFAKAVAPMMDHAPTEVGKEEDAAAKAARPTPEQLLETFDPEKLDQAPATAAAPKEMENDAQEPVTPEAPAKAIRLRRADVEAEARFLHQQAMEQRDGKLSTLEQFVKDNGGISTYREGPTGQKEELEEYRNIPVRLRGRTSYDEMRQMAMDRGVLPADAPYSALYDELSSLPERGAVPKVEDFYDEARHNLEHEKLTEAQKQTDLPPDVAASYAAEKQAITQTRAKAAAQQVLRANKIDQNTVIKLVDAIAVDNGAFKQGYHDDYDREAHDVLGVTYTPTEKGRINAVIELARGATESTGRHEAFHAVTNLLLDDNEQAIIRKAFEQQAKAEDKDVMEVAADAFGDYRAQPTAPSSLVHSIFEKIKAFLDRLNNYLDAGKFTTADDLFEAIDQGKFADRAKRDSFREQYAAQKSDNDGLTPEDVRRLNARADLRSPEFKAWFGESKIVDENGKPLIVYHGSGKKGTEVFDVRKAGSILASDWGEGIYFTPSKWMAQGYRTGAVQSLDANARKAWADFERAAADMGTGVMNGWLDLRAGKITEAQYKTLGEYENRWRQALKAAEDSDAGGVYPVYLKIENPFDYTYGGITEPGLADRAKEEGHDGLIIRNEDGGIDEIVAFEPTQIKSAFNLGSWNPNDPRIQYQSVYHGSPHRFDRFTTDKMGTGEGHQAYGWGLYFAGRKEVGQFYRDQLGISNEKIRQIASAYDGLTDAEAVKQLRHAAKQENFREAPSLAREYDATADWIEKGRPAGFSGGRLYTADIPDDSEFLDHDTILRDQPKAIQEKMKAIDKALHLNLDPYESTGEQFYEAVVQEANVDTESGPLYEFAHGNGLWGKSAEEIASRYLASKGIPGLKYLDQLSRGAAAGTSNYVIFDDSRVKLLKAEYAARRKEDPNQMNLFGQGGEATPEAKAKEAETPAAAALPDAGHVALPKTPKRAAGELADVGDQLWYNRRNFTGKNLTWDEVKDLNPALKVREVTKAKVWERPDYAQLVADGMHPFAAHILKQIYDSISARPMTVGGVPTDAGLKSYIEEVNRVKPLVFDWIKRLDDSVKEDVARVAKSPGHRLDGFAVSRPQGELLDMLYPPQPGEQGRHGRFRNNPDYNAAIGRIGGNKVLRAIQAGYREERTANKALAQGFPEKMEAWQRQFAISEDQPGTKVFNNGKSEVLDHSEFYVYRKASSRIMGTGFRTRAEAEEFARGLVEGKKKDAGGDTGFDDGELSRWERQGPPRRETGENIEPQRLMDTFGFRGVNFGNWVNDTERQEFTNAAYDALADLADLIKVPAKALSLNGLLGLAFGAQGRGGAGAALAHFIAGVNEINLTKKKGAGALAHEWAHALDHYFAVQAGERVEKSPDPFLSHQADQLAKEHLGQLRPEILNAFKTIVATMKSRLESPEEVAARTAKQEEQTVKRLESWIKGIADRLKANMAGKPESEIAEALAGYEKIARRIREGLVGDGYVQTGRSQWKGVRPVVAEVRDYYRRMVGRKLDDSYLQGLNSNVDHWAYLHSALAESRNQPQKTDTAYLAGAKKADEKKGGAPYWSRGTELLARAFQSFVLDRLAEQSQRNDYLTRPQRPNSPAYPQGVERTAINKAFDTLLSEVKTRETERGTALYSAKPKPVFSQMERTLEEKLPNSAPVAMIKNILAGQGVKREEVEWSGINTWLDEQKGPVSKKAVLDFVRSNTVDIQEVLKGRVAPIYRIVSFSGQTIEDGFETRAEAERARDGWEGQHNAEYFVETSEGTDELTGGSAGPADTKFDQWVIPGGENYRELLLTLPEQGVVKGGKIPLANGLPSDFHHRETHMGHDLVDGSGDYLLEGASDAEYEAFVKSYGLNKENFRTNHFPEPNILAHIRFNERRDADNKRVLFIEEIQSDWHEKARQLRKDEIKRIAKARGVPLPAKGEKGSPEYLAIAREVPVEFGYGSGPAKQHRAYYEAGEHGKIPVGYGKTREEALANVDPKWFKIATIKTEEYTLLGSSGVPNAPFKTTWHELAMKRALRWAVENGFDRIAWTTGEQQAARYDLSKQIGSVALSGTDFKAFNKNGDVVIQQTGITEADLPDLIGKDAAAKLIAAPKRGTLRMIEGEDLKIGGEGMIGFYDQMLPAFLNKYTKKWGGRVGETTIDSTDRRVPSRYEYAGPEYSLDELKSGLVTMQKSRSSYDKTSPFTGKEIMFPIGNVSKSQTLRSIIKGIEEGLSFKQAVEQRGSHEAAEILGGELKEIHDPATAKVHSLDITPDMQASIPLGQPLYAAKIKDAGGGDGKIPDDVYAANRALAEQGTFKRDLRDFAKSIVQGADAYLGAISTRLGNIHPSIRRKLREFEFRQSKATMDDLKAVEPFLKKVQNMSLRDRLDFDLARKNGDAPRIQRLVVKYQLTAEYFRVRRTLNKIHERATQVGFDVGYRENYHPRKIKDVAGFLMYMKGREDWSILEGAIRDKEAELGRFLTDEEQANLINQLIRGYARGKLSLSETGNMKDRLIEYLDPDLNRFYYDSDAALVRYLGETNNAVEARRFFGKGNKKLEFNNVADSIGAYVVDLLKDGLISPTQEKELSQILLARFGQVGTSGLWGLYKNLSYIDTMGSPISAISQIQDLAFALYQAGPLRTATAFGRALARFSKVTREDLGIERIAEEFRDANRASMFVSKVFKVVGLEWLDALGKEALVNASLDKFRHESLRKKPSRDFTDYIEKVFGDKKDEVLWDLRTGQMTDNVKLLLFNRLADMQPIALSEMPEKYLTGGNGRVFYMLKTYTLKQFDIYRNEVYNQMRQPGAAAKVKGLRNLTMLSAALVALGAGTDMIKDLLLRRPLYWPDTVVDNLWKTLGAQKWAIYEARRNGPYQAIVKQILPPAKFVDSFYKDFVNYSPDAPKGHRLQGNAWTGKKWETPASIPVVGKFYYWWFGKGTELNERRRQKIAQKKAHQ